MAAAITLRVITPEAVLLDTTAESVQIPGLDGSIGILPRHAPMVAALGPGELQYTSGGKTHHLFVASGFAEVRDNTVRVVSDASEFPEHIDVRRAEAAIERAKRRLQGTRREGEAAVDIDTIRAELALRRAMMRLRVAKYR